MAARRHRCLVVPLTQRSADALVRNGKPGAQEAQAAHLLPTQLVKPEMFDASEAALIDKNQRLPDGTPLLPNQTWASSPWSIPGNVRHDWKYIKARYADQPEVLAAFEKWAEKTAIPEVGMTVDEWLGLPESEARRMIRDFLYRPFDELEDKGLLPDALKGMNPGRKRKGKGDVMAEARWPRVPPPAWADPQEVDAWRKKLSAAVMRNPLAHGEVLRWEPGPTGPLSKTRIERAAQSFLDLLPREVAGSAGTFQIKVVETLPHGAFGSYDPETSTLTLAHNAHHKDELAFRARIWHEMSHWLWFNSKRHPRLAAWRSSLEKHFATRTAGDVLETAPDGWEFLRDQWIDTYAGRFYKNHPDGVELAAVYFEQIALGPERTAGWMIEDSNRETFNLVTAILGGAEP